MWGDLCPLRKVYYWPTSCFDSHIGVLLVWLYTHSRCLFFVRILTCGYKCGYKHLFLLLNYIDISLLGVKFESGLRTKSEKSDVNRRLFLCLKSSIRKAFHAFSLNLSQPDSIYINLLM